MPLEALWEKEVDAHILDEAVWAKVGQKGFDPPRLFSAYLNTLRWNNVTATDPKLFQAPWRAGIDVKAYQLEPLRKALLLPRVNLFILDEAHNSAPASGSKYAIDSFLMRAVRDLAPHGWPAALRAAAWPGG